MEKNIRTITSIDNQPRKIIERSAKNKIHIITTKGTEKKIAESGNKQINTDNNQSLLLPSTSKSISPDKHFIRKPILKKHKINLKTKTEIPKKIEDNKRPKKVTKTPKCEISEDDGNEYSKENIHEEMQVVKTTVDFGNDFVVPGTVPQDRVINSEEIIKETTEEAEEIKNEETEKELPYIIVSDEREISNVTFRKHNIKNEQIQSSFTSVELQNEPIINQEYDASNETTNQYLENNQNNEISKSLKDVNDQTNSDKITTKTDNINCQEKNVIKNERKLSLKNSESISPQPSTSGIKSSLKETPKIFASNSLPFIIHNSKISDSMSEILIYKLGSHSTPRKIRKNKHIHCIPKSNWGTPETNCFRSSQYLTQNIIAKRAINKNFMINKKKIDIIPTALINPVSIKAFSNHGKINKNKKCKDKNTGSSVQNKINKLETQPEIKVKEEIFKITPVTSLINKFENIISGNAVDKHSTDPKKIITIKIKHSAVDDNNSDENYNKKQEIIKSSEEIKQSSSTKNKFTLFEDEEREVQLNYAKQKFSFTEDLTATENSIEIKQSLSMKNKFTVFENEEKEVQLNYAKRKFSFTEEDVTDTENFIDKNNYKRAKPTEQLKSTDHTEARININKDNTNLNERNIVINPVLNHDFKTDQSEELHNDFNNFSENKKQHCLVTLDKEITNLLPVESNESINVNISERKSPAFQYNEEDFPPLESSVKILLDDFISGQTDFTKNDKVLDKKISSKREDIINDNQIFFEYNEKEEIIDEEKETSFNDELKLAINVNNNYNPGKFITDERNMKNQDFFVKSEKEENIEEQETSFNDNLKPTINVSSNYDPGKLTNEEDKKNLIKNQDFFVKEDVINEQETSFNDKLKLTINDSSNCDTGKLKTNEEDERNVMKNQGFFVKDGKEDVINEQEVSFNDRLKLTINVNNTYDPGRFITDKEEENDTPTASISMLFNIAESISTSPLTYSEYREEFYKIMSLKT